MENSSVYDVIVIGGGQSALACGYYLRRTGLKYLLLDKNDAPGGSWQFYWDQLRLFSPATWSSLPGTMMGGGEDYYPSKDEVVQYLIDYEVKYQIPVKRNSEVVDVTIKDALFRIKTIRNEIYTTRHLIDATGAVAQPFIPKIEGLNDFQGKIFHSIEYQSNDRFSEKNVLILGEGNSGAQILSEVSKVANTYWATSKKPEFLPDHVDGRYLFDQASLMYKAKKEGKSFQPLSLGDIVMTPAVKGARKRNVLISNGPIKKFKKDVVVFENGDQKHIDAIIFCTGFRSELSHLESLIERDEKGRVQLNNNESLKCSSLYFVGHGNWTGFASATIIGVGRTAKSVIHQIAQN